MAKYITAPFGVKSDSDRANPDKTQQCLTYDILSEGEIEGLENPSSENLCKWIWKRLSPRLPILKKIEIKETDLTGCIYKGE